MIRTTNKIILKEKVKQSMIYRSQVFFFLLLYITIFDADEVGVARLASLEPPHFVRRAEHFKQNNCLIDATVLSLQSQGFLRKLTRRQRADIASAARIHLETHHGLQRAGAEPPLLEFELHFDPVC